MIRRPPRSTQSRSSAASDVYKRQPQSNPDPGWPWLCLTAWQTDRRPDAPGYVLLSVPACRQYHAQFLFRVCPLFLRRGFYAHKVQDGVGGGLESQDAGVDDKVAQAQWQGK